MKRHTNCLFYVLDKQAREGGYVTFGASKRKWRNRLWPIPHALHLSYDGKLSHFIPPNDANLPTPFHSWIEFDGEVVYGDPEIRTPMSDLSLLLGVLLAIFLGGVWVVRKWIRNFRPIP